MPRWLDLRRTLTVPLSGVALCALVATACSPKSDAEMESAVPAAGTETAASRDACTLITKQEADSILGGPMSVTPGAQTEESSTCDYISEPGQAAHLVEGFTLEAQWTGGEEGIERARTSAKAATDMAGGKQDEVASEVMGLTPVTGLGDEAYFSRRVFSYVRKGDALLVFQLTGMNEPARERWEALARVALARLP